MNKLKLGCLSVLLLLQYACIKKAPVNPEADIISFSIPARYLTSDVFIDQINSRILLNLTPAAFDSGVVPIITVSEGAHLTPPSGDSLHFSTKNQNTYVVTSASGVNQKTYVVTVVNIGVWQWDFEIWRENAKDKYQYPIEANEDSSEIWSSGNPGIALSGVPANPLEYPLRATTDAYHGKYAAEMVTRKGTALSELVGIKLFAGSLFLGVFDPTNALFQPLKATQFGQPYIGKPARFMGYYKYTPGDNYQDKSGTIIPGIKDSCSLYAVLFKGTTRLDGTNIQTSDRIVAIATLPDGGPQANYKRFDVPFIEVRPYEATDQLMLAIVASSSKDGDSYKGAIGSRLVLDSMQVTHQ
ncbi:hypothetical protein DVR12_25040 [Chitinophaga silvatica]|uniref:Putative carbohydrate metabolism domain-containing protein n=1 Tax=Chitinophaga silvatica TaxID=2282649 RepID=A0A3E1Y3M6_9BACT|nr:PCMD domain-containing protein [Chitinophaga silvatica]RFS19077.1 hypothetical protein DVR12_25040 [Chitinophaga silvatica]